MSSDIVIQVENLGKRYRIRHQADRPRYTALRDVLAERTKSVARRLWSVLRPPSPFHGEGRGEVVAVRHALHPLPSTLHSATEEGRMGEGPRVRASPLLALRAKTFGP